jgi:hypothetical protein
MLITTITDQVESIAIAANAFAHHPTTHDLTDLLWSVGNAMVTIPHVVGTDAIGAAPLLIVAALIGRRTSTIKTRRTPRVVAPNEETAATITCPF